jgi:hypothetical protein
VRERARTNGTILTILYDYWRGIWHIIRYEGGSSEFLGGSKYCLNWDIDTIPRNKCSEPVDILALENSQVFCIIFHVNKGLSKRLDSDK